MRREYGARLIKAAIRKDRSRHPGNRPTCSLRHFTRDTCFFTRDFTVFHHSPRTLLLMRTLAIGDIHGCYTALTTLVREVQPAPDDRFVFLGDYIDRGPESRAVLDWLIHSPQASSAIFLRGNHEVMILEAREDSLKQHLWGSYGGFETLVSYSAEQRDDWYSAIPPQHWSFLERTVRFFQTPKAIFVHACMDPDADMEDQPDWLLYWEFFDRIRPHKSGKKIICGHTVQRSGRIEDLGFAACIDTGPSQGGWLSCLDVESGEYWQANERGEARAGRLAS